MLLLENHFYYTAMIHPFKIKGARDIANKPVAGYGLLFYFYNNNSSTTVQIVRQKITFAGPIMSILISLVENHNIARTPSNECMVVLVSHCLSCRLKCNEYTSAMKCEWNLGLILHHLSALTLIKIY